MSLVDIVLSLSLVDKLRDQPERHELVDFGLEVAELDRIEQDAERANLGAVLRAADNCLGRGLAQLSITWIAKASGDKKVIWNRRLEQMRFELRRQPLLRMVVGSAEPETAMLIVGGFDQPLNQRLAGQQPVHPHLAEDGDPLHIDETQSGLYGRR